MTSENNSQVQSYGFAARGLLAILITIGGFCSLAAGDYFFASRADTLTNQILTYLIPFAYLFIVYSFARKFNFANDHFFNRTTVKLKPFKTFFIGLLCMAIPLGFSSLGSVLPYIGKKPMDNFVIILIQLVILNLCIGFFEEGLFRRVILRVLFKDDSKKSLWIGFLLSSFLFGLIHLGNLSLAPQRPLAIMSQVIYAVFLGMLLAGLYLKFQSFVGVAILHAFVDFLSSYPRLYGQVIGVDSKNAADISLTEAATTVGVLIPSAVLGIIILISFSKKYYANK